MIASNRAAYSSSSKTSSRAPLPPPRARVRAPASARAPASIAEDDSETASSSRRALVARARALARAVVGVIAPDHSASSSRRRRVAHSRATRSRVGVDARRRTSEITPRAAPISHGAFRWSYTRAERSSRDPSLDPRGFFAVVARRPRIASDIAIARVARVVDSNRVHCAKNLHVRTIGRADARKP
jgi:hypothetical protein